MTTKSMLLERLTQTKLAPKLAKAVKGRIERDFL